VVLISGSTVAASAAALAKRLGDGGHDKTERGEPTHSPDQQLRHAAVFPCCQRMAASYEGKSRKSQCQKKNPAVAAGLFVLAGLLVNDASPASQRLAEVSSRLMLNHFAVELVLLVLS
jgi:hypothetical protein